MYRLLDKALLFLICSLLYYYFNSTIFNIIFMLTAIIATSITGYFNHDKLRYCLIACYFILAYFKIDACFFIPLILYDSFFKKESMFVSLFSICFIVNYEFLSPLFLLFYVVLICLAMYLCYRSNQHQQLLLYNKQIKDDSEELRMLQEFKQRELLDKQDYEIQLAKEQERNRIAREIHDSVGHNLSSSLLQMGAIITLNQQEQLKEPLFNVKTTLFDGMDSIRNSVHDLHQDHFHLKEEMLKLIEQFTFCKAQFQYQGSNLMDLKIKYCFINILKECLHNISKHSNATNVKINFFENLSFYQFSIHDNGTINSIKDGLGLKSMYERVYAYNGICTITNTNGFKIFINIPKEEQNENSNS